MGEGERVRSSRHGERLLVLGSQQDFVAHEAPVKNCLLLLPTAAAHATALA